MTGGHELRSALARAFLAAILGAMLLSAPGYAAEREVLVTDGAYKPVLVTIEAGDTVAWGWASSNGRFHTVTALDGRFDSDRDCGDVAACRKAGNDFTFRFSQPGIYVYRCKVEPVMVGRVEVAEPKPQEPPPPPPPPSGGQQQQPQTSTRPAQPAQPAGPAQQSQAAPPPPRRGMAAVPGLTYAKAPPAAAPAPPAIAPAVAPRRDPLSILPEGGPRPVVPEAPPEPPAQELALEVPARPPEPPTGLVVGIAIATLLVTAGAFGKFVLFRPPWS